MVCNAGIGGGAPVADLSDELFRRIVDVNLFGVFACCRAAARSMIPRRSGVIVTIGSVFGQDPPAGSAAYGAAKAGVAALTKSLARELGPDGIRVNCVSPGHIETNMYASALQRRADGAWHLPGRGDASASETRSRSVTSARPMTSRRWSHSSRPTTAPYVTGQRINVDGGLQPL